MTLAELNAKLAIGVNRPDLTSDGAADYSAYVNQAIRQICQRRSWTHMRTVGDFTIAAGATSVALPANFKELTRTRSPVDQVDASTSPTSYIPATVYTEEKLTRLRRSYLSGTAPCVAIDRSVTPPTLSFGTPTEAATVFRVRYYAFPDELVNDADTNFLTTEYPDMVLLKAKQLAFEDINDPLALDMANLYEAKYRVACGDDANRALAGVDMHM